MSGIPPEIQERNYDREQGGLAGTHVYIACDAFSCSGDFNGSPFVMGEPITYPEQGRPEAIAATGVFAEPTYSIVSYGLQFHHTLVEAQLGGMPRSSSGGVLDWLLR